MQNNFYKGTQLLAKTTQWALWLSGELSLSKYRNHKAILFCEYCPRTRKLPVALRNWLLQDYVIYFCVLKEGAKKKKDVVRTDIYIKTFCHELPRKMTSIKFFISNSHWLLLTVKWFLVRNRIFLQPWEHNSETCAMRPMSLLIQEKDFCLIVSEPLQGNWTPSLTWKRTA